MESKHRSSVGPNGVPAYEISRLQTAGKYRKEGPKEIGPTLLEAAELGQVTLADTLLQNEDDGDVLPGKVAQESARWRALDTALPSYIKPLRSGIEQCDLEYLHLKGVFILPTRPMRNKLWEIYFQNVHPALPILDHAEIVRAIRSKIEAPHRLKSGASQISLLVFHCVTLVVQVFLGKSNSDRQKRDSLHSIFEKARVLYDLGLENDQMANLQSALLMSLYPQPLNCPKGQAYWISQAISIAYTLGLQREPSRRDFNVRCRSVRKQLWWSLYIRERMTVLDLGLPSLIDKLGHDVQMLTYDDFIVAPLQLSLDELRFEELESESESIQHQLGLLFIEKAKLAILLSRLPTLSATSYEWGDHLVQTQWPRFQGQPPDSNLLRDTANKIKQWRAGLPLEVLSNRWSLMKNGSKSSRAIGPLYKHCATLFLTYRIAMHHLAILRWLTVNCLSAESSKNAARSLLDATLEVIYMGQEVLGCQVKGHGLLHLSIIRPLLLSVVLNERSPQLVPTDITKYFQSVLQEIGDHDTFYLQARSYLEGGIIGSHVSRPPQTAISDSSMTTTESVPQSLPNVFDALLGDIDMNIDASGSQFPIISRATESATVTSLGSPFKVEEIHEDEAFKLFLL